VVEDKSTTYSSAKGFSDAFRSSVKSIADSHGYDVDFLLAAIFVESGGSGYISGGRLKISF